MPHDFGAMPQPVNTSYSQEGEDVLMLKLFARLGGGAIVRGGFFVDVGAHHPVRYSNTCLYSQRFGWTGVNIDPTPGFKVFFDQHRPGDVNLELGIGPEKGELLFHMFDDSALNTFDPVYAEAVKSWGTRTYLGARPVPVDTLANVLDAQAQGRAIDLLSVDAESFDLAVLNSSDWERYRPKVALVEALEPEVEAMLRTELHLFMGERDYVLYAKTYSTCVYVDRRALAVL